MNKPSIVVNIKGGLGNQLFQYAFGRVLSLENDLPLFLDTKFYKDGSYGYPCLLEKYPIKGKIIDELPNAMKFVKEHEFRQSVTKNTIPTYFDGYWQDEKYFKQHRMAILNDLKINTNYITIKKHSVSIHVRRGDYIKEVEKEIMALLTLDYYKRAMEYIESKVANPNYYVFSDDIHWCVKNIQAKNIDYIIDCNLYDPTCELRLMSSCDHNIIANSTFSWWGAWLNLNRDKMVIAPDKWYECKSQFYGKNPACEGWVRIEN